MNNENLKNLFKSYLEKGSESDKWALIKALENLDTAPDTVVIYRGQAYCLALDNDACLCIKGPTPILDLDEG